MRDGAYVATDRDRRDRRRRAGRADGRPRGRRPLPQDRGDDRRRRSSRSRGSTARGVFHDVSFQVRAGEIVGLAGLVGAGRSEIARAVFGVDAYDAGTVTLGGSRSRRTTRAPPIRAGMAFVPEDRRKQGLVIEGSVARNVAGGHPPRPRHAPGVLTGARREPASGPWAGRLEVKTNALDMAATTMSGGNQQKVVIAKWLATEPAAADHRRAHPRHRRRHQGRGAPAAVRARRPGAGDPDDLLRAARGARHGRPRPRRLRGPDHRRARPRRGHPRERHARRHPPRTSETTATEEAQPHDRPPRRAELDLPDPARARRRCSAPARSRCSACWSCSSWSTTAKSDAFLFSHDRLARPAAHAVDPAAARDRPDGRDHHPQRRPVRRLDARAHGVPHRPAVHRPPGPARSSWCSLAGMLFGAAARPGQRRARRASARSRRW